jgi:hypothetical protein
VVGKLADRVEERFEPWVAVAVHRVPEPGQVFACRESAPDRRRSTRRAGLLEEVRRGPARGAVERTSDGGEPGHDGRQRVGANRRRDPDGQRARGELVIGEQDQRPVDRRDELAGGSARPRAG